MPKVLANVDWDLAEHLYAQGLSCVVIGGRLGVNPSSVRTRAMRGKWREKVSKAQEMLKQDDKLTQLNANKLIDRTLREGEEWLDAIALKRQSGIADPDDVLKLVNAWKVPIEQCRKALGLDDGSQVKVTAELRLTVADLEVKPANVIEVETGKETVEPSVGPNGENE